MSGLDEAIEELGRHSWTGVNIIQKNQDWYPIGGDPTCDEHVKTCPVWPYYEQLVMAAIKVKSEWLKHKRNQGG